MHTLLPQHTVPFYGDQLVAVQEPEGAVFVLFGRLCANLDLDQQAQARRIRRHAVLSEGLISLTVQTDGGPQQVQALKLSLLPLWLANVQIDRVKTALKDQLVRYQREAADVLWQAFRGQIVREDPPIAQESSLAISQLEQLVAQSRAMQRMAAEQIAIIRRMDSAARVVKGLQSDVAAIHVRLGVLEDTINPAAYMTDAQASEVSTKVKALAEFLTKQDSTKNHYQGIYSELYRRFSVSGYKLLRREQFEGVVAFLDAWRAAGAHDAPA